VQEALVAAIEISARSWKSKLGVSLNHPEPGRFIRRLTEHAHEQGWLSIWLLRLDGKPVAMEYQLIANDCVYALRSDFDEQYTDLSPGAYLNRVLLERLFSRGSGTYFMGPGMNAYKWRWTEEYETIYRLTAYSPAWRGRLFMFADQKVRPVLRKLRDRARSAHPEGKPS
jgi:CelD/BcsL family acetyltransferase involved in cellulose biosynthesis